MSSRVTVAELKNSVTSLEGQVMALISIVGTLVRRLPPDTLETLKVDALDTNATIGTPSHIVPPPGEIGLLADKFIEWICSHTPGQEL